MATRTSQTTVSYYSGDVVHRCVFRLFVLACWESRTRTKPSMALSSARCAVPRPKLGFVPACRYTCTMMRFEFVVVGVGAVPQLAVIEE